MDSHTTRKLQQVLRILTLTSIHKELRAKGKGHRAKGKNLLFYALYPMLYTLCSMPYTLCTMLFLCHTLFLGGCGTGGQSLEILFTAADSQLASAQEAGAEQLAKPEFDEARVLYTEAEMALEKKDKETRILIQRAHAKARLAEALARKTKAEAEVVRAETELEQASAEASRVRAERMAAESELNTGY